MNGSAVDTPRAVIVVSSHVARGSVGNRAAVFALETLGHPVWAVPTVLLPWHPGHGRATRIVPDADQFSAFMKDLERAPWLGEVAGVLSGYLGDARQAVDVAALVHRVKARNPDALYVCDPVMGDAGGLYVPEATAEAIAAALDLGPPRMLVTSAPAMMAGGIGNLLVTPNEALLAEHRQIPGPPNGLGDLTAAVFLARLMAGQPDAKALQTTTAAVYEILARTAKRGGDELQLETDARSLSHPMAMVQFRHLTHPGKDMRA